MLTGEPQAEIQQEVASRLGVLLSVGRQSVNRGAFDKSYKVVDAEFVAVEEGGVLSSLETLVRVIARAVEVLGTGEKALRWLNTPIRSLGDQTPKSLLANPDGAARVEDALGRIEHGVW